MGIKDDKSILVYLQKSGPTNTFKLARDLGKDRNDILNTIKELEDKKAVEFKSGTVKFLKFPEKEGMIKKPISAKKIILKPKKNVVHKPKKLPQKRTKAKEKVSVLNNLLAENKKLNERLSEVEENVKKQSDVKSELRQGAEHLENLEKTINEMQQKAQQKTHVAEQINALKNSVSELQQKAELPPKIIKRIIIKNLPTKIVRKTIIRNRPAKIIKRAVIKPPTRPKMKNKVVESYLGWVKNTTQKIKQFKLPKPPKLKIKKIKVRFPKIKVKQSKRLKFAKPKIKKMKINFSKLNKKIQQIHTPNAIKGLKKGLSVLHNSISTKRKKIIKKLKRPNKSRK